MTKKETNIILFSVTLCWAASYLFIKDLPSDLSSFAYITVTAGIAALVLLVLFFRRLALVTKTTLLHGLVLSLFLMGDLLAERAAMDSLSASESSFISSLNILFVPLLLLFWRIRPAKNHICGFGVILFGIFMTHGFRFAESVNRGTVFMLVSCLFMALYTIFSVRFVKQSDAMALTILQMCFCTLIGFAFWFMEDQRTFAGVAYTKQMLSSVFILAFFAQAYAYTMLMFAEKYSDAISVTIIASTEPVVTFVLALLIPNAYGETEHFHIRTLLGAVCIAVGVMIAGWEKRQ